jgi:acyl-CoA synthetase (AMP-forming)/AMP-acid ligase II
LFRYFEERTFVFAGSRRSVFISRTARFEAVYPSCGIVSGSEWISSADIENVACLHPDVASAVWTNCSPSLTAGGWWKPDAVVFVESVPLGATGKVLKHSLRKQYGDDYLSA